MAQFHEVISKQTYNFSLNGGKGKQRFNCPICEGNQKSTVSIDSIKLVGYCHRCSARFTEFKELEKSNTDITFKPFDEPGLNYWNQYGITKDLLFEFDVLQVDKYKGRNYADPVFAYKVSYNQYKIYNPLTQNKQYKFIWSGGKPTDWHFGYGQLSPDGSIVFITGGEKDVLTFQANQINAITLNSESITDIDKSLLEQLRTRFKTIAVLYDNDQTGRTKSQELALKYDFELWQLPAEMKGMDISDLIANGGSINDIKPVRITNIRSVIERQMEAKKLPPTVKLFGDLWYKGELCILAGDNGAGKSILALNIVDQITKGKRKFIEQEIEVQQQKALFYDFELSDRQFGDRVGNHSFSENFLFSEYLGEQFNFDVIRNDVEYTGAKVIIVDNMTALSEKNTIDQDAALIVLRGLNKLKKELGLSILVIAHTPKIRAGEPLTINEIAGSKVISNLIDSAFFIGKSSQGNETRYIKQVKTRSPNWVETFTIVHNNSGELATFDYDNVCDETEHLGSNSNPKISDKQLAFLEYIKNGEKIETIVETLGISRKTYYNWKDKFV